jgi:hypothetical protein
MATTNITSLRFMRLRDAHGIVGHALSARVSAVNNICVETRLAPINGLAQGRIVSISRGSPPLKQR